MSDKITVSTFQLFEMFPDQESARKYLESCLWPNGVKCPFCGRTENITARKNGAGRGAVGKTAVLGMVHRRVVIGSMLHTDMDYPLFMPWLPRG